MFGFLKGWTAVVLVAVLAGVGEGFGHMPWVRKIAWTLAALVAIHGAWSAWTE